MKLSFRVLWIGLWLTAAFAQASPPRKPTPELLWRLVPNAGGEWNREGLLRGILAGKALEGKSRSEVLTMLGAPGYSATTYPGGDEIDEYRLSSRNDSVFRIDYTREGKVQRDAIESSSCVCEDCAEPAPAVPKLTLSLHKLLNPDYSGPELTVAGLERMLGKPGKWNSMQSSAGGQVWLNYADTWRLSGDPNQYFIADGHVPVRQLQLNPNQEKLLESWSVVTFHPNCLAR